LLLLPAYWTGLTVWNIPVAVAVGVAVRIAVAVSDGSVEGVSLGVGVGVGDAVTVAVPVAVAVWVSVAVKVEVAVSVAVGVEGVEVEVDVGLGVGTGSWVLLIRIRCGAFAFVPLCTNSAVKSYSPGATAAMFNVVTMEVWVGWTESASTFFPFVLSTLSLSRYLLSWVPDFGWTVTPTWSICGSFGASTPSAG
jgi:hypothetical protein